MTKTDVNLDVDKTIKASSASFKIEIAGYSTSGRLLPVQVSAKNDGAGVESGKGASFRSLTPEGLTASQVYRDENGRIWERSEMTKRGIVDKETGEVTLVDAEAVAEARQIQGDQNVLNLKVVRNTPELHDQLFVDYQSKSHVFVPMITKGKKIIPSSTQDQMVYRLLLHAARQDRFRLIGTASVSRGKEHLYSVMSWRGHLVLQCLAWTDLIEDHQPNTIEPSEREASLMDQLLVLTSTDFEPGEFEDASIKRLMQVAMTTGEKATEALPLKRDVKEEDILAALEAHLASLS